MSVEFGDGRYTPEGLDPKGVVEMRFSREVLYGLVDLLNRSDTRTADGEYHISWSVHEAGDNVMLMNTLNSV